MKKIHYFLIPLFALAILVGCTPEEEPTKPATPPQQQEANRVPPPPKTVPTFDGTLLTGKHTVVIKTSMGQIVAELDADKAPKTVTNFVQLAESGYYNNLTFHRVIPDFMLQGGDPSGNGTGGESIFGETFEDEDNDIVLDRGVLAMANRGPNTNGSQFFIIQKEGGTPWLQGRHTGFGTVIKGMDVVDAIAAVDRDGRDMPLEPVTYTMTVR